MPLRIWTVVGIGLTLLLGACATSESAATDGRTKQWLPFDEAVARLSDDDTRRLLQHARPAMNRRESPDAHDA